MMMFLLCNDGHILQLWSETVTIPRGMTYDDHIIPGSNVAQISWYLSYAWGKTPEKTLTYEIDTTGDRTRTRCVRSNDATPRPQRWSYVHVCQRVKITAPHVMLVQWISSITYSTNLQQEGKRFLSVNGSEFIKVKKKQREWHLNYFVKICRRRLSLSKTSIVFLITTVY